jgi:hypothetical protein
MFYCAISLPVFSHASEQSNNADPTSVLHKLGNGKMNFLFWHVYNAEFYAKNSTFEPNVYPQALKLTYKRNIDKADFIDATLDQWNKLHKLDKSITISPAQQAAWVDQLENIFPNIKTNDIILFAINENNESQFSLKQFNPTTNSYNNHFQTLGKIKHPEFGPYFISIWLSEHTTEPELRQQLIGKSE